MARLPENNLYEVLGVTQEATAAELRAGYLQAARACHPDLNRDNEHADEQFKLIRRVYEILSDPLQRAAYDGAPDLYQIVGNDITVSSHRRQRQEGPSDSWKYRKRTWQQNSSPPRDTGFRPQYAQDRRRWETVPGYLLGLTVLVSMTLIPIGLGRMLAGHSASRNATSAEIESPQPLEVNGSVEDRLQENVNTLLDEVKQEAAAEATLPTTRIDREEAGERVRRPQPNQSSPAASSSTRSIELQLDPPFMEPFVTLDARSNSAAGLDIELTMPGAPDAPASFIDDSSSDLEAVVQTYPQRPRRTTSSRPAQFPNASIPTEAEWQRIGFGPSSLSALPSYPVRFPTSFPGRWRSEATPRFGADLPVDRMPHYQSNSMVGAVSPPMSFNAAQPIAPSAPVMTRADSSLSTYMPLQAALPRLNGDASSGMSGVGMSGVGMSGGATYGSPAATPNYGVGLQGRAAPNRGGSYGSSISGMPPQLLVPRLPTPPAASPAALRPMMLPNYGVSNAIGF